MNYKKLIGSRNTRLKILSLLNWIPDSVMIRLQYLIHTGRRLYLKNPKRFTEKIQAYKLQCRIADMLRCTDKYEVRKYVAERGLKDILIPLIGVYDSVEDIDSDSLPAKFVAKTTDGGGGNQVLVCRDKSGLGEADFKATLNQWMSMPKPKKQAGREWAYENGFPRRIVIEALLEDERYKDIPDYKFWCFNGTPMFCQVIGARTEKETIDFFDMDWHHQPFRGLNKVCGNAEKMPERPSTFYEMKKVAEVLSRGFPFVRVDLYEAGGKVYFGELTFYPAGGYGQFTPDSYDYQLGSHLNI